MPWHILAPAAVACDIYLIRRSAHPRGAFLFYRKAISCKVKKSHESTSQLFYGSYTSLFYFLQIKLHRFEIPGLAWEVQAAVHQGAAASYQFAVYFVHGIRFQPSYRDVNGRAAWLCQDLHAVYQSFALILRYELPGCVQTVFHRVGQAVVFAFMGQVVVFLKGFDLFFDLFFFPVA